MNLRLLSYKRSLLGIKRKCYPTWLNRSSSLEDIQQHVIACAFPITEDGTQYQYLIDSTYLDRTLISNHREPSNRRPPSPHVEPRDGKTRAMQILLPDPGAEAMPNHESQIFLLYPPFHPTNACCPFCRLRVACLYLD